MVSSLPRDHILLRKRKQRRAPSAVIKQAPRSAPHRSRGGTQPWRAGGHGYGKGDHKGFGFGVRVFG